MGCILFIGWWDCYVIVDRLYIDVENELRFEFCILFGLLVVLMRDLVIVK